MAKIVRLRRVKIHDDDGEEIELTLKNWSAHKLFFLIRQVWDLIEEGLKKVVGLDGLTDVQIISIVVERLLSAETKAATIIKTTVVDPKDLSEEAILEWDANDFLSVLNVVIEMNVNDDTVKNFRGLLNPFRRRESESQEPEATPSVSENLESSLTT